MSATKYRRFRVDSCRTGLSIACLLVLVAIGSSGCKLLTPDSSDMASAAAESTRPAQGQYVIEVRRQGEKPQSVTLPLYGTETISTALTAAGVTKKKGAWDIELMRTNPENGNRHRMFVEYETAKRQVRVEQDYALFPNDHLVVKQSSDSPLDDLFGNLLGE